MTIDDFERTDDEVIAPWKIAYSDGTVTTRWVDPTPAGEYSAISAACKVCGRVVTVTGGETIRHGDPRLCGHMGGPAA